MPDVRSDTLLQVWHKRERLKSKRKDLLNGEEPSRARPEYVLCSPDRRTACMGFSSNSNLSMISDGGGKDRPVCIYWGQSGRAGAREGDVASATAATVAGHEHVQERQGGRAAQTGLATISYLIRAGPLAAGATPRFARPASSFSPVSCNVHPSTAVCGAAQRTSSAYTTTLSSCAIAPDTAPDPPATTLTPPTASGLTRPSHAHVQLSPFALGPYQLILQIPQGVISTLHAPTVR